MKSVVMVEGRPYPVLTKTRGIETPPFMPETIPVHEAGHAVIALALGGEVWYSDLHKRLTRGTGWPLEALAAGERAADLWLRRTRTWTPERAVAAEVQGFYDRSFYDYRRAPALADRLLERHWLSVLRVAGALAEAGQLTGNEIRKLL